MRKKEDYNRHFSQLKVFAKWQLAEEFLKIKKFPNLCWDLNRPPLAYEARTKPQDYLGKSVQRC